MRREKKPKVGIEHDVVRLLLLAPETLFSRVGTAASRFIRDIAKDWDIRRESEFKQLWEGAWRNPPQEDESTTTNR